jgi:hypothetical protein
MGRWAGVLLGAAGCLLPSAAPALEGPPDGLALPAGPRRTKAFQERVDASVARGLLRLLSWQDRSGSFAERGNRYKGPAYDLGIQAIAHYALRACGARADDPAVQSSLRRLRQYYLEARRMRLLGNYQVSLTVLALEAHYEPAAGPGTGGDRYGNPAPGARAFPPADLEWLRELTAWLVRAQTSNGGFGYHSPQAGWEDHSNAQYSLLALKAARRCGIEVPVSVFRKALDHFLAAQEADGPVVVRKERARAEGGYGTRTVAAAKDRARGWGYQEARRMRGSATGSMTTAGVSSLVICRSELLGHKAWPEREDARTVQAIHDGIAWLGRHFSVEGNPTADGSVGGWHYYYLYGLERAGVLSGVAWMGDHDWYGEGADHLVKAQDRSGGWAEGRALVAGGRGGDGDGEGDVLSTCFALLFLKKATFRVEGAVATEEDDETLDLSGAAGLDDASFGPVFDLVFARYLRAGPERRGTLAGDFVRLGPRALPLLVRRLEDDAEPGRAAALQALEAVTGQTLGFRAGDPGEVRGKAVAAWEEWWFARRAAIVADPGAGRFR